MVTIGKATYQEISQAIEATSARFNHNIESNRFEQDGKTFFVTLKAKDSHGEGARIGFTGRALPNACWHVYGNFFDELFRQNPEIVVIALGKKITNDGGNWEDSNVGSLVHPRWFSEMCHCADVANQQTLQG